MESQKRIIVNTVAQYSRTIINVCLSLYSTRLILSALGQSDYGIYSLIAGVIAMLSFVTNSLMVTTQRFISVSQGEGNAQKTYSIFGNSMLLHLLFGILMTIILVAIEPWLINHFLNIEQNRLSAASGVYFSALLVLLLSCLTAPYRALFIARENIVFISLVDVFDGVFKFVIAILLTMNSAYDKLVVYALSLIGIALFNLLALAVFAHRRYDECHFPCVREWDNELMKKLGDFAGWTIYSTGCIIARTQGVSILLNKFFSTVVNAAYGLSMQVSGAVQFVAQSVVNAMLPQIMKAEGNGERAKMLRLSQMSSKYAFLLLSCVTIPVVFEIPDLLRLWLGTFPEDTVLFCQCMLIACLIDQLTIGLGVANQAIGNIRNYSLVINSIKVLTLPFSLLALCLGADVVWVMICYMSMEFICAMCRLPFLYQTAELNIREYVNKVFVPILLPIATAILICYLNCHFTNYSYRFLVTGLLSVLGEGCVIWFFALTKQEKEIIYHILKSKRYVQPKSKN